MFIIIVSKPARIFRAEIIKSEFTALYILSI